MENLRDLETHELMEMLVQQTAQLTAKIAERDNRGVDQYKYELALIQAEINSRLHPKAHTTISDNGIEFTSSVHPAAAVPNSGNNNSTI